MAYRKAVTHLDVTMDNPVMLPVPLSEIPTEIGSWTGQDVAIPDSILRIAGNDDYIYRLYQGTTTDDWVHVYVSYSGRPRTMVGHRPSVCYVAAGWVCEETVQSEFQRTDSQSAPCLIHRFYKPGADGVQLVVLNYYILNGTITNNERGFTGLGWRSPNIAGDPAHYVAQVQISSVLESQVRSAAQSMTDLICEYLPDRECHVKAAGSNMASSPEPATAFNSNLP
jgi:hypothetical protein